MQRLEQENEKFATLSSFSKSALYRKTLRSASANKPRRPPQKTIEAPKKQHFGLHISSYRLFPSMVSERSASHIRRGSLRPSLKIGVLNSSRKIQQKSKKQCRGSFMDVSNCLRPWKTNTTVCPFKGDTEHSFHLYRRSAINAKRSLFPSHLKFSPMLQTLDTSKETEAQHIPLTDYLHTYNPQEQENDPGSHLTKAKDIDFILPSANPKNTISIKEALYTLREKSFRTNRSAKKEKTQLSSGLNRIMKIQQIEKKAKPSEISNKLVICLPIQCTLCSSSQF